MPRRSTVPATPAPDARAVLDRFLERYSGNPAAFVVEMIGLTPDPWQASVMRAVAEGERRISIRSAHGVGKSATLAWLAIWYVLTHYPCKVVMTAPSASQLYDTLFAETRAWINNLPEFLKELLAVTSDKVALKAAPDEVFISARTSRAETPEAMQGVHSEHVLLLADEASAIPEEVFNAAQGSMSGHSATTILTGNPTRTVGYFYETHTRLAENWRTFHVTGIGNARVSTEFVREVELRSGLDSNEYRVRVLGEFPLHDDETIIALELAMSAVTRDVAPATRHEVWGLDCARFGSDKSCLVRRAGNVVTQIQTWADKDMMQLCGLIHHEWEDAKVKPASIMVDSIGIGAGVIDRLAELTLPAFGVNVSELPSAGSQYRNLRAELWYRCKAWLTKRDVKLPKDDSLIGELTTVRYTYASNGKILAESKEDMKRRGLKSPNAADALMLTFAAPEAVFLHGALLSWREPLRRHLKGIV